MKNKLVIIVLTIFACTSSDRKDKLLKENLSSVIKELEIMVDNDRKYRGKFSLSNDSIYELQLDLDTKNTLKLIEITNQYGFPNVDRIGVPLPAWLIFHHSPYEFKDTVLHVINKEYESGRLPNNEYQLIKWHLSGRNGAPFGLDNVEVEQQ